MRGRLGPAAIFAARDLKIDVIRHPALALRIVACAAALLGASGATAQTVAQGMPKLLPLDGTATDDGIRLVWDTAKPRFAGNVEISRRALGQTGRGSWQVIAPALGPVLAHADTTAAPGTAWEYRVRRLGREVIDQGFYAAGNHVPLPDRRGTVVVVTEAALATPLAAELTRLEDDLAGEGWNVRPVTAPGARDATGLPLLVQALELKAAIVAAAGTAPDGEVAIILIGALPLVASGMTAPDGHAPQPLGTDLFYADFDGRWTGTPDGNLRPAQVPDGTIEAAVGRIDFSNMGLGTPAAEEAALRAYLERNHAWRTGKMGVRDTAYVGKSGHLFVEEQALRNMVGQAAIHPGGHADAGQSGDWLFGIDFGPASSEKYTEPGFAAQPVFALNFGSHKQKIRRRGNQMNALLLHPNRALAVAWGARPAWWLHGMAMGETIGAAQRRTVNNGPTDGQIASTDYLPSGSYPFFHPIWGNLLGDPTLHAFPVPQVRNLQAERVDDGVRLVWDAPDAAPSSYRIYRENTDGSFDQLAEIDAETTTFTAPATGESTTRYMVRPVHLRQVHAGSLLIPASGTIAHCCVK